MLSLSNLGDSASILLEAFAEELEKIPSYEIPPGRYVGSGEIPWDGPGLYLYIGSSNVGQPGAPQGQNIPTSKAIFTVVGFYVMLIRPASSFGYLMEGAPLPVPDATLNAEGIRSVNDAGQLLAAAKRIRDRGDIVSSRQAGFVIGAVTPIGPQGGLSAMRLYFEASIEAQ